MGLNHADIFDRIQALLASTQTIGACMGEIISLCARDVPHGDWSRLAALDFDGDVASLSKWIPGVFERHPAPFPVQGLWIGLFNPCVDDKVTADMYVGAMSEYDPRDEDLQWLNSKHRHFPGDADAQSVALRRIHEIGYDGENGLGNEAEWPLCLAFAAFAVPTLLRGQTTRLVGSTASRIGVVVGFESGDMLLVGELTDIGFVTATRDLR